MHVIWFFIAFLVISQSAIASNLSVYYEWYDHNKVYEDSIVKFGQDYNFVILLKKERKFPVEEEKIVKKRELPSFLAIRVSQPSQDYSQGYQPPKSVKNYVITVYFPFNSSTLTQDQERYLISEIQKIKSNATSALKAEVRGYACVIGESSYNKKLSLRRAKSVSNLLIKLGIDVVKVEGLGEIKDSSVMCLNRKTEIYITE